MLSAAFEKNLHIVSAEVLGMVPIRWDHDAL